MIFLPIRSKKWPIIHPGLVQQSVRFAEKDTTLQCIVIVIKGKRGNVFVF